VASRECSHTGLRRYSVAAKSSGEPRSLRRRSSSGPTATLASRSSTGRGACKVVLPACSIIAEHPALMEPSFAGRERSARIDEWAKQLRLPSAARKVLSMALSRGASTTSPSSAEKNSASSASGRLASGLPVERGNLSARDDMPLTLSLAATELANAQCPFSWRIRSTAWSTSLSVMSRFLV